MSHSVLGDKRKELEQELSDEQTRVRALEHERQTLERQEAALAEAMSQSTSLLNRCAKLLVSSAEIHSLVEQKLFEYHDLVSKTDEFRSWANDLANTASSMKLLGVSEKT